MNRYSASNLLSCATFLVALSATTQPAIATVTYSDGATYTVNGASPDISLLNSTTLKITSGAVINGPSASPGGPGIVASDETANLIQITGGSITGGLNPQASGGFGGDGVIMQGGTLDISGGTFTGGTASFVPGFAVTVRNSQSTISGGTFYGGDVTAFRASDAVVVDGGNMTISGGSFHGGNGYIAGVALTLGKTNTPASHVVITGGTFAAGAGNAFQPYGADAVVINHPDTILDLKGGQFTGAFLMESGTVLNVYGYGLTATPLSQGKHIAGTLLDGSPLSIDMLVFDPVTVNLINVPEPATLVMGLIGAAALGAVVLRKRLARG